MLSENELIEIATNYVNNIAEKIKKELVLPKEIMIKKNYGIYFVYHSKKYWDTKDSIYSLLGNAPFLVENKAGKIIEFGTSRGIDHYIQEYEAGQYP